MNSPALHQALLVLGSGGDLSMVMSQEAVSEILRESVDPVPVAAFLTALRVKGEVADELAGAVQALLARMTPFEVPAGLRPVLDTCGTGGDGANTVNISTAAAIVVAACGVRVAKHGNRSASGNSGSAEVLTELGVRIDADPSNLIRCLGEVGITFLYAPQFHPALRHVGTIRRQLPFRTLFNLVGPLANPARPDYQLIGVPDRARTYLLAMALSELRASPEDSGLRAFVIAGANGLDEVSLSGTNFVECVGGPMARLNHVWAPAHFQLPQVANHKLAVTGPVESARKIRSMLSGEPGPIRNVILANAAAALFLCEKAAGLVEGVALATQAVDRGDAARLLERWATLSHQ